MTKVTQSYGSSIKGVLGTKLGMTQVFDANNKMIPVTVVSVESCVVTSIRTPEKDGYSAVQLGFGAIDPKKVSKPLAGHYAKSGVTPRRSVAELRTLSAADYTVGQEIGASTFAPGDIVTLMPYFHCGHCVACTNGKPNCCASLKVFGVHIDGGMSEYIVVPVEYLLQANDLTLEAAALVEPVSRAVHAVDRLSIP